MSVRIINADVLNGLAQLPDESVHCVVTSPPYWGLRDYGAPGQIGLEPTLTEHITKLVDVFREVRRVLRKDGTLWLNYGDAYAGSWGAQSRGEDPGPASKLSGGQVYAAPKGTHTGSMKRTPGLKPKDLLMMPERLAIALQDDGWYVRARIIWAKPNPMPESVTDRPTKSHEHIWLMSRSPRYFYDAEAIREDAVADNREVFLGADKYTSGNAHGNSSEKAASGRGHVENMVGARNARDVWTIATSPFPEAHFATFPPELAERCIRAGTSEKGCCAKCGTPWVRVTTSEFMPQPDVSLHKGVKGAGSQKPMDASNSWDGFPRGTTKRETIGWRPACTCNADAVPCSVLDPFGGSGTTGLVADRLQRSAILIELNPTYAAMARKRVTNDCPLFVEAAE